MNDIQRAIEALHLGDGIEISGKPRRVAAFLEGLDTAMQELQQYRQMEAKGLFVKMPCAVGDTVYEVSHDDIPVPVDYIAKYPVEDVSVKGIRYAGDWIGWDELRDTYFNKGEAEERLREMAAGGTT